MLLKRYTLVALILFSHPAWAASDVNTKAIQSVISTVSSVASTQTASIVSSAATGGFSAGGAGGFSSGGNGGFSSGGSGGFNSGGNGGFNSGGSPGGESSGGGQAPSGGGNGGFGAPAAPSKNDKGASANFHLTGRAAGDESASYSLWSQALWAHVDKTEPYMQMRGNVYNGLVGVDHHFDDIYTVGVAAGYEAVQMVTRFNNGTLNSSGVSITPYAAVTLSPTWTLDASVGYSLLRYDSKQNYGTTTSHFNSGRFVASSDLVGVFAYENWRFQPKATLLYVREQQAAFVDNNGTYSPGSGSTLGRLSGGGKTGYLVGDVLPYIKLIGDWDFTHAKPALKSNGDYSNVDLAGGTAGIGVESTRDGLTGSLEVDNNSVMRKNTDVWAVIARFKWDF